MLGAFGVAFGQVGINTDSPKQTLDIDGVDGTTSEGTLRIKDTALPQGERPSEYLAWRPVSNTNDPNNGQIVGLSGKLEDKPFQVVEYTFHLTNPSDEYVNSVDLGIPKKDYTVMLMQYRLIDGNGAPVFMRTTISEGLEKQSYPLSSQREGSRGLWDKETGPNTYEPISRGYISISNPIVMVFPDPNGSNWKFHADYPDTKPLSFNWKNNDITTGIVDSVDLTERYTWKAKMLIVKNTYIHYESIDIDQRNGYFNTHPIYKHKDLGKK